MEDLGKKNVEDTEIMEETKELSADDILGTEELVLEKVEVPEWGGYVFVKMMSALERDSWEYSNYISKSDIRNIRGSLLQRTICDKNGVLKFGEDKAIALGKKGSGPVERIFNIAQRINKLRNSDLEEMTKN